MFNQMSFCAYCLSAGLCCLTHLPMLGLLLLAIWYRATYLHGYINVHQAISHATAIPSRKYPFSTDQGSQPGLGSTSTRLSDRPGTLSAVVFLNRPHHGARHPVLLPILFLPSYLLPFHLQLAWPSMQTQSVWLHSACNRACCLERSG